MVALARVCLIQGCEAPLTSRGLCIKHYSRWRRHGDANHSERILGDYEARFASKVLIAPNGCWLWQGFKNDAGYGKFGIGDQVLLAHRWAYEHWIGPLDERPLDHFFCDTPACVNPAHVRLVTPRENSLRSKSFAAMNLAKTECIHGHPFDEKNTYIKKNGDRDCRACHVIQESNRQKRLRRQK